ncbi:hypothetical protein [Magnetospira sp. QH-2]|uniref:hypothetical protein n=1 Tax=Magnetospira sp. (strain QH-2) TaxID=1288970 RepID=UPI0003E810ED|nr:hypothetical protein [Magnetospira sp. QH-2]CCQ74797.1 protein of unknown function [Magnetospira sp. QH-2]
MAAQLLKHYLGGSGRPVTLESDFVRHHEPSANAQQKTEGHFESWLSGDLNDQSGFGDIQSWLQSDQPTLSIKGMKWEARAKPYDALDPSDQNMALGKHKILGVGDLTLTRQGDKVIVRGVVEHRLDGETYDFAEGGGSSNPASNLATVPQGLISGDIGLTRDTITDYERAGGAQSFPVSSDPWKRNLIGELTIRNGKIINSIFDWKDVK